MELMAERMDVARKIGEFKRDNNMVILQSGRWDEIVKDRVNKGEKKELTEDFVRAMFDAIHQESIRHQVKIMNTGVLQDVNKH
jgi:chorismate mutase